MLLDGTTPIANGAGMVDFGSAARGRDALSKIFTVVNSGAGALLTSNLSVPSNYTIVEPLDDGTYVCSACR